MLEKSKIEDNYNKFIELLKGNIKRDGIDKLIDYLNRSDFKTAPASTKYHCAYEGGLCQHCLNVYDRLNLLIDSCFTNNNTYSNETIAIVALLHDISKVNLYESDYRNVKVYSENGSKYDENGKFDWQSVKSYKQKETKDRFIYGSHAMNSIYMIRTFINLSYEEELAVLYHMGGFDYSEDSLSVKNISEAFTKSPLALLLHQADMQATYISEKEDE